MLLLGSILVLATQCHAKMLTKGSNDLAQRIVLEEHRARRRLTVVHDPKRAQYNDYHRSKNAKRDSKAKQIAAAQEADSQRLKRVEELKKRFQLAVKKALRLQKEKAEAESKLQAQKRLSQGAVFQRIRQIEKEKQEIKLRKRKSILEFRTRVMKQVEQLRGIKLKKGRIDKIQLDELPPYMCKNITNGLKKGWKMACDGTKSAVKYVGNKAVKTVAENYETAVAVYLGAQMIATLGVYCTDGGDTDLLGQLACIAVGK